MDSGPVDTAAMVSIVSFGITPSQAGDDELPCEAFVEVADGRVSRVHCCIGLAFEPCHQAVSRRTLRWALQPHECALPHRSVLAQ